MSKILLVQPNYSHQRKTGGWGLNPPLGLCYVASEYMRFGNQVEILDANLLNLTPQETAKKAEGFDSVGVSVLTPAFNWARELAQLLPKSIFTMAGGAGAAGLEEFYHVYKGTFGESAPARHLIEKGGTDKPYYSAGTRYFPWAAVMTSFGCPYDCYYCNKKTFGYQWKPRTPEDVCAEIENLVKDYGVKEIDFYDDCFNFDIERARQILVMIKRFKLCLRFSNGLRVDKITPGLLLNMKDSGTEFIAYGIESGNQAILDRIPKKITLEQIRQAVTWTKEAKIEVMGFFILGLLGDTTETMQDTIDFAKELDLDYTNFALATPYPGTRMYDDILKNGKLLINSYDDYHHQTGKCIFTYPNMATPTEIERMYKLAFRSVYLRPSEILKQVLKINSLAKLKGAIAGAKRVFYK